ncbi:MAG: acyloxyacyl hydrolase [Nitrospiria bacterium]
MFIDDFSIGVGQSKDSIDIYRFGLKKDFGHIFLRSNIGWLSGYYEASLNYWQRGNDDLFGVAFSPVFVYNFGDKSKTIQPYIEGGIGAAYISDTEIGSRDLTTHFQFEDRAGLGIRSRKVDLNFRYMHYSNGSIKQPNEGIDIFIFTISFPF